MSFTKDCDPDLLSLGLLDFSNIRERKIIYVDKTKLISQIARQRVPIFFSRPRRFGKSLLVNTLSNLFKNGLSLFSGLDIEKSWNDKTYQVIHIDFSEIASSNSYDFNYSLSTIIIDEFGINKQDTQKLQYPNIILGEISKKLNNNSTVLLIDEYDAPLVHHINDKDELKNITNTLNNLYSTIKRYTDKFRFVFITGVTRVSHLSIFSAFNNLLDISLDEEFNDLLGFTQDDLEQYFDSYIENAAKNLNMDKYDVYKRIEQYYDGFQFSINAKKTIYNPWSILSFLKLFHKGFRNYWFKSSGSSSLIMEYIKQNTQFNISAIQENKLYISEDKLTDRYDIKNIPIDLLLFQTGYLTIRKESDEVASLVYPNTEVEDSFLKLYLATNNLNPEIKFADQIQNLPKNIDERNLKEIIDTFNAILNDCVSMLSSIFNDERSIRDIIYAALPQKITLQKIKERETVKGRSDLELLTQKTHMVIEFKRTKSNRDGASSLKEAVQQLTDKNYGVGYFQNYKLYRVAMVISTEEKKIPYNYCKEITN